MGDSVLCSVNDVWVNETVCVNKEKGSSEDMHGNAEVSEVKCAIEAQENSNAHVTYSIVIDRKVNSSEQMGCEGVPPEGFGPDIRGHSGFNSEFLDCPKSDTPSRRIKRRQQC